MTNKLPPPSDRHIIVCAMEQTLADHAGNPNCTLIKLLGDLCEAAPAVRELVVVSDKVSQLRDDVIMWLNANVDYYHRVIMRPPGVLAFSAGDLMRARILSAGGPGVIMPLPSQILCAFDGRAEVRAVWGSSGVPCLGVPNMEGW